MDTVYNANGFFKLHFTIRIYNSSCADSFPMVETISQIWSEGFNEVTLRTKLIEDHEVYVDNSMSVQK
jgi:hypothetical protein